MPGLLRAFSLQREYVAQQFQRLFGRNALVCHFQEDCVNVCQRLHAVPLPIVLVCFLSNIILFILFFVFFI